MNNIINKRIKLLKYASIVNCIGMINLALSVVTYMIHIVINNEISKIVFSISFISLTLLGIVHVIIETLVEVYAIKIDKLRENKRD